MKYQFKTDLTSFDAIVLRCAREDATNARAIGLIIEPEDLAIEMFDMMDFQDENPAGCGNYVEDIAEARRRWMIYPLAYASAREEGAYGI